MNKKPIGIFDSGLGGLTTLKPLIERLPNENFVYLGDTKRNPYGTHSEETILKYAKADIDFMIKKKCKFIISACGTVSTVALPILKEQLKIPLLSYDYEIENADESSKYNAPTIGIVYTLVSNALKATKTGKIGVMATTATVKSKVFEEAFQSKRLDEIWDRDKAIEITSVACPLLISLVEYGFSQSEATMIVAKEYCKDLIKNNIDTVILGCTHFPLLKDVLKEILGESINLIIAGEGLADYLEEFLKFNNLENDKNNIGTRKFYITDDANFEKEAELFFGEKIEPEVITL